MRPDKHTMIFALLISIILNLHCAFAINTLAVSPDNLWYSVQEEKWIEPLYPQIQINAECNYSDIDEVYIRKALYTSKVKLHDTNTQNKYSAITDIIDLYTISASGIYTVESGNSCGNETLTTEFTIHNLDGSVENIEGFSGEGHGPIYLGDSFLEDHNELHLYVKLYDIVDSDKRDISIEEDIYFTRVKFIENTDIAFSDISYSSNGPFIVILKNLDDKGISKDTEYTLKIDVNYIIDNSAKTFSFSAKRPIIFGDEPKDTPKEPEPLEQSITISHDSEILFSGEPSMAINLEITTHNIDNFTLNKGNLGIRLYRSDSIVRELDISAITRDSNDYTITVDRIPPLDKDKSYEIKYTITHNTITKTGTMDLLSGINFEGVMKDSSGVVVPATLEFSGPVYKKITVAADGRYHAMFPAGTYDITITYTRFSSTIPLIINIYDAEITSELMEMAPNPVKFSYYSKNVNLHDMAVADLVDFQFALPFKTATIRMPYDASKIYNEEEIEVYICSNWNSERKDCIGGWTKIDDITINRDIDFISFNTGRLSAFVISGRETLSLEINPFPEDYFSEEEITITGKVTDDNSNAVKDAIINYCIKGADICGTGSTDISGDFKLALNAPKPEGKYELIVGTQKEPYHSGDNQSHYISIEKMKDLTVILPEISSIVLDDPSQSNVRFKLKNTGQASLTNLKISVSAQGLSRDKYTVDPAIIESLEPGNEKDIIITIPLTSEYCQNMGCMTVYSFSLDISADQLKDNKAASLIVEVKTKEDMPKPPVESTVSIQTNETTEMASQSNSTIMSYMVSISGIADNIPQITGLSTSAFAQPLNTYMILVTIILCFIIIALKRRRQKTGVYGPRHAHTSSFNIIKKHIKGR